MKCPKCDTVVDISKAESSCFAQGLTAGFVLTSMLFVLLVCTYLAGGVSDWSSIGSSKPRVRQEIKLEPGEKIGWFDEVPFYEIHRQTITDHTDRLRKLERQLNQNPEPERVIQEIELDLIERTREIERRSK